MARSLSAVGLDTPRGLRGCGCSRPPRGRQLGVLLAVGQRVEPQQRGLLRRAELAEADPDGVGAVGAACGRRSTPPPRSKRSAASASAPLARSAEAHVVGVRVEHHDPQVGLHQEAARAGRRASRSCPSPTDRTGTCGGRSRPRRGERDAAGQRQLADLQRRALGRGPLEPGARPRPAAPGARGASWKGRPSPSSTTPSPLPTRITHLRAVGAGRVLAAHLQRQHLAQAGLAAPSSVDVAARLELEAVQRGLEAEPACRRPRWRAEAPPSRAPPGRARYCSSEAWTSFTGRSSHARRPRLTPLPSAQDSPRARRASQDRRMSNTTRTIHHDVVVVGGRPGRPRTRLPPREAGLQLRHPRGRFRAGGRVAEAVGLAQAVHACALRRPARHGLPGRPGSLSDT